MSSSQQSLENQIELLLSFENFILNLQTHLLQTNNLYKKLIGEMVDAGMMKELVQRIEGINQPEFEAEIQKIWSHLGDNDRAYAKMLRQEIENTLNSL